MLKYELVIDIRAPRDRVVELFLDRDQYRRWQPTLVRLEPGEGDPGTTGATATVVHKMGPRDVAMREVVTDGALPERYVVTYQAKKVFNRVTHRFEALPDGGTRLRYETEFELSGPMKLIGRLAPGMFKKQSRDVLGRFKTFAEANA